VELGKFAAYGGAQRWVKVNRPAKFGKICSQKTVILNELKLSQWVQCLWSLNVCVDHGRLSPQCLRHLLLWENYFS